MVEIDRCKTSLSKGWNLEILVNFYQYNIFFCFHFWGNIWRRIRIRNQNLPITSGFWDIWGYVLEKWGFSLLLRLCTRRKKFFWLFSQLLLLIPFKMSCWTVTRDFFSQRYGHIFTWNTVFSVDFDLRHWIYHLGNGNVNLATPFS